MTPEAQQRAIAIACGKTPTCAPDPYVDTPDFHEWRDWRTQTQPFPFRYRVCSKCPALNIEGERYVSIPDDHAAPDYLHDANAAATLCDVLAKQGWKCALENGLDTTWECTFYKPYGEHARPENVGARDGISTEEHYGCGPTLSAAVSQSFLRVIGQWVEETESQPCP